MLMNWCCRRRDEMILEEKGCTDEMMLQEKGCVDEMMLLEKG